MQIYLAFKVALKAAKVDRSEKVANQNCIEFIIDILPVCIYYYYIIIYKLYIFLLNLNLKGVGGDDVVYEDLAELLYMLEFPFHQLVGLKNKLHELSFKKYASSLPPFPFLSIFSLPSHHRFPRFHDLLLN
jgi:hypothetical protein